MSRTPRRRLRRILLIVLAAFLLAVFAAPWIAGLPPVRRMIAQRIADRVGRDVHIDDLEVGWTSGVKLHGLRIAGDPRPEFSGGALVEVRHLVVEDSLADLVFGDGPSNIVVDGLRLNVEEQAGGRTNLDDLLDRFAPAPPPIVPPKEVPPRKPAAPRPLRIELSDAQITLRRLPYRPPERPVDSFKEDPVIRPADEGLLELRLERFGVKAVRDATDLRLEFDGEVVIDGKRGTLRGELKRGPGGDLDGLVRAAGIDLGLLDPLLRPELGGLLDLDVVVSADRAKARAVVTGLRAGGIEEERAELVFEGERTPAGWFARKLLLETASEEYSLRGAGPLGDLPGDVALQARLSVGPILELAGRPIAKGGVLMVDLTGTHAPGRSEAKGELTLTHLRIKDETAQASGPTNVTLEFDASFEPGPRRIEFRRLFAASPELELTMKGDAALRKPLSGNLTGSGHADLDAIRRLVAPLAGWGDEVRLTGDARLTALSLSSERAGEIDITVRADVTDLRAEGLFAETVERERTVLLLDARLSDEDVVIVNEARIDELVVKGRATGLLEGPLSAANATVQGSLQLDPLLARLAGIRDLDELSGMLAVNGSFAYAGQRTKLEVEAHGRDLRVAGPFGSFARDRVTLGLVSDDEKETASVSGPGFSVTGRFERREPRRIDAKLEDASELTSLVPGLALPEDLELRGPVQIGVDVAREDGLWRADGRIESGELTARWQGRGPAREPFSLDLRVRESARGWNFDAPRGRLDQRGTEFSLRQGFAGRDGSIGVLLVVDAPLDRWPELAEYKAAGTAQLEAQLELHDGRLGFDANLTTNRFAATWDGQRYAPRKLAAGARGRTAEDGIRIESLHIDYDESRCTGSGTIGDEAKLALRLEGDLATLEQFAAELSGRGPFRVDLDATWPLLEQGGPFRMSGTLSAARVIGANLDLDDARGEFLWEGHRDGERMRELTSTVVVGAKRMRWSNVAMVGGRIQETGRGIWRSGEREGFAYRLQLRAEQLDIDDLSFRGVAIEGRGDMPEPFFRDRRQERVTGTLSFESAVTAGVPWSEGSARIAATPELVQLTDLSARVYGGRVSGSADVRPETSPAPWRAKLKLSDVRLTEELGKPLSFIVPILRLSGSGRRQLTGALDGELDFRGAGTSLLALQRSLGGGGTLHLRQVGVQGSLLLPLLSLRIDRLIRGKPYTFDDVKVRFRVSEGRVRPDPFKLSGQPFSIKVEGDAGLDGSLDFLVRPSLLPIPLRVKGNLDKPKVRPAPLAGLR